MKIKLYVGNLSSSTTEDDLHPLFAKAGQIVSVAVIKDRDTGDSKGFALIEMGTQTEAHKAVRLLDGFHLGDHKLRVKLAQPRRIVRASGFSQPNDNKRWQSSRIERGSYET